MSGRRILVINPGSSSLKVSRLDGDVATEAQTLRPGDLDGLSAFVRGAGTADAAGVRFVHGGDAFRDSVLVDSHNAGALDALGELAPLHNPPAADAIALLRRTEAGLPVIACFDTAFHATIAGAASVVAIPERWREGGRVRRYGFHGFGHRYASRRAAEMLGRQDDATLRVVSCHLGAGASLAAVRGGVSVETTMGLTPLDGLIMATRPGNLDPGVILHLLRHESVRATDVEQALEHESGLLALSGEADMRIVLKRAVQGDRRCILARDAFVHRLVILMGSMIAALGGVDAVTFSGGIGENAAEIRRRACEPMSFAGVSLDGNANDAYRRGDAMIGVRGGDVAVMVIEAREDLEIARDVARVLGGLSPM